MNLLEEIADKIILELKTDMPGVKTVDLYEGQFEQSDINKIIHYFPAAFLGLPQITGEVLSEAGLITLLPLTWDVYIADRNLLSKKTNIYGVWGMIIDTLNSLQGNRLGLKHTHLNFQDSEQLVNLPGIIIYRVTFNQKAKV